MKKWIDAHPPLKDGDGVIIKPTPPFPIPTPEALNKKDVYENMRRTLVVTLSENNGIATAKARYKLCAWDYDIRTENTPYATFQLCPCKGAGKTSETTIPDCFCTHNSVDSVFYSSEANVDLKNLYIFYYPNYVSDNRREPFDTIEFRNEANYPVNLYVVKQNSADITDRVELSGLERGYRMNLTVIEDPASYNFGNWITNPGLFKAKTKLRTNLDFDISEPAVEKRQEIAQMNLTFKDQRGTQVHDITAEKILSFNGLDDRQPKDRIYKVAVEVYRQGAAEKGFPEEELIVSLDGSKED